MVFPPLALRILAVSQLSAPAQAAQAVPASLVAANDLIRRVRPGQANLFPT